MDALRKAEAEKKAAAAREAGTEVNYVLNHWITRSIAVPGDVAGNSVAPISR
jgi:hypothetical protein